MNEEIDKAIHSLSDYLYNNYSVQFTNQEYQNLNSELNNIYHKHNTEEGKFATLLDSWKLKIPFTDAGFTFKNSVKLNARYFLINISNHVKNEHRKIKIEETPFINQTTSEQLELLWDKKRPNYKDISLTWIMFGGEEVNFCKVCNGNRFVTCKECSGKGIIIGPCNSCLGLGKKTRIVRNKKPNSYSQYEEREIEEICTKCHGDILIEYTCPNCRRRGEIRCKNCKGNGSVFQFRKLISELKTITNNKILSNEKGIDFPWDTSTKIYRKLIPSNYISTNSDTNKLSDEIIVYAAYIELYRVKSNDQETDIYIRNGVINYPDENFVRSLDTHTNYILHQINGLPDAVNAKSILKLVFLYLLLIRVIGVLLVWGFIAFLWYNYDILALLVKELFSNILR